MATPRLLPGDSVELRKQRGAFFTPYALADFMSGWALAGAKEQPQVLDPTCGEGVFLLAAAEHLRTRGLDEDAVGAALHGVDLHDASLQETQQLLAGAGRGAHLLTGDFFEESTPAQLDGRLPWMDAVVGNPPFVRYQEHRGETRRRATTAALEQGVRLSGLASSWAALLVHSCAFLKPEGRVAMVLPAELLTVGYAEPIRRWLRERFAAVHLVFFESLQFHDAEEQVVLLIARGSGGCDAFALHQLRDADDLNAQHLFDAEPVALGPPEDKWTDLLLPLGGRTLFRQTSARGFTPLSTYGKPELGTVTGANKYFALSEATRRQYNLKESDLTRTVPPGSRHVPGTTFTEGNWQELKRAGERVWLLNPADDKPGVAVRRYIAHGEKLGVHEAYKCTVRTPWWRPPVVRAPDLFFTYMSNTSPRLVTNDAGVSLVNSMHGVTLTDETPAWVRDALPVMAMSTMSMLGAELYGRAYGGGILKMEPREAGQLPVPNLQTLEAAWELLAPKRAWLDQLVKLGAWKKATAEVDQILLCEVLGLSSADLRQLQAAAAKLRRRRTRRDDRLVEV